MMYHTLFDPPGLPGWNIKSQKSTEDYPMPSILDTPETVHQEQWQPGEHTATPATSNQALRHSRSRLLARLSQRMAGARKRQPQLYWWDEEAPKPLEAPMDRLAREFPQLFLLGNCG